MTDYFALAQSIVYPGRKGNDSMTDEQMRALVNSLQDLEKGARLMAMRTTPSDQFYYDATQFHEGRADAFAEVLALLKLAGVDVGEKVTSSTPV